ncbi:MAG: histidine ammonia-lyase [Bdellovibrionaceae bacterium]|nr:histidine ammonia-lyase [Pseudobdellovibrionaceae bacterium]
MKKNEVILLTGSDITTDLLWKVATNENCKIQLSDSAILAIKESRNFITEKQKQQTIYGVNTGFGAFSKIKIPQKDIQQLQKNLIRSHSAGVGSYFSIAEVRAIIFLRANALARGKSGIRVEVVQSLIDFLNHKIYPAIPEQGSVGASGDLAPLSHLALSLIGEGKVLQSTTKKTVEEYYFREVTQTQKTEAALKEKNITPLTLQFKEGLALINGCQAMTAVGLLNIYKAQQLIKVMDLAGAMSLEALRGSRSAFDPIIFQERPHYGEAETAKHILNLLGETSSLAESHKDCLKVQDAYSLRCLPAVHGAFKQSLNYAQKTLEIEANSSTDNPLVFSKENKILSCGNFHGEPVAMALDFLTIATTSLSNISERRIAQMINPSMSDLPAFLTSQGGLNSGMMIVQVAAASLVSENKTQSFPASVDSIPTSVDKEDHVSMGSIASRKLRTVIKNTQQVAAMELLCACQALDLLKPLSPAAGVLKIYTFIRTIVPYAEQDRNFSEDIQKIYAHIQNEELLKKL